MSNDFFENIAASLTPVNQGQPQNEGPTVEYGRSTPEALKEDMGRKRMTKQTMPGCAPVKRRKKALYRDAYRQLFNSVVADVTDVRIAVDISRSLDESQIGLSTWTAEEKQRFFSALTRLGKDDVRSIARSIGSKSVSEVTQYLRLLQAAYSQCSQGSSSQDLVTAADMPAALEITEECCAALEIAADDLMCRQENVEALEEQHKWGNAWVLNHESIRSPMKFGNQIEESHEDDKAFPAAILFNMENWIMLSSRIFMNPSSLRAKENRQNMIQPEEEIGIRATAFEDFYNVVINLMRRLIASTIFCAMSRIRSQDTRGTAPSSAIKRADVVAAVNILGLEPNSQRFWIECARRCNLSVYDSVSNGDSGEEPMAYSEVEDSLRRDGRLPPQRNITVAPQQGGTSSLQDSAVDVMQSASISDDHVENDGAPVDVEGQEMSEEADDPQAIMYSHENVDLNPDTQDSVIGLPEEVDVDSVENATEPDDSESESYANMIDLKRSRIEEQQLWKVLGVTPPLNTQLNGRENAHQHNSLEATEHGNSNQWRNNIRFRSEWENLGTILGRSGDKHWRK